MTAEQKPGVLFTNLTLIWLAWFFLPFVFIFFAFVLRIDSVLTLLHDPRFLAAFAISFASAFVVMILAALLAVPTAYVMAFHPFRYPLVLEALLIDIPQTFPPVAVGVIYLFVFGAQSPLNIAFTFAAVVVAKLLVSAPFVLGFSLRRFREIRESKLDLVARSLGARRFQVFFRVLLPLARQDIAAGLTLCWARAMGEFGGSLIFAGVIAYRTEIIPTYTNRVVSVDPLLALAATGILSLFAIVSIVIVRSVFKQRVK